MVHTDVKKFIFWIPVLIWMSVIFYLSHQPGSESSELSSDLAAKILYLIELIFPVNSDYFHHFIRKSAHFIAYFILGILVVNALRIHNFKYAAYAFLICVLYAISDEVHQLFIPGRSGEVRDVLIDGTGAFIGIGVYFLLKKNALSS
ncbi:VanZ family protein [Pseudogracilibacillus sp. SO30301A]|uniref:VanZ family protein n=1 Tax=Pseudogracilibacillus sp. SO30301A TaxID=3098291 RepID=UPI00300DF562